MRKEYLFTMLFLIAIAIQSVSASPFAINYSYVNTDSEAEYLNVQYGNYYDNFSLRLRLQAQEGYNNVPVYVSPQIYGVSSSGDLTYLYSVPTQTYYAYSTPYEYTYSNLYYINPNYYGYVVKVYANSYIDYYYNTYSYAYVYPVNNDPYYYFIDDDTEVDDDTTPIIPDCSDFFLSGQADISLDEGDEYTYNLYIENEANEDLEIIDVETSNTSRLDVEDIDSPQEVPDLSVRTIRLYLQADSVSDDYDSSFDVTVKAKYDNTSICTKTYTIEYHIEEGNNGNNDNDNDNDVSCSDFDITNISFTIDDDYTSTRKIKLENDSDYDFEINDITISDRDGLNVSIVDEPDVVDSGDYEYLEIELDADNFDYVITKYLDLKIKGTFVDSDDDEIKDCTRTATITVRIEDDAGNSDNEDYDEEEDCKDIDIYAMNISQAENTTDSYSKSDGFYIINNSNTTFTINSFSINDNSSYASISDTSYTKTLTSGSTGSINFDLKTNNINSAQTSRGTILVSGKFSGGKSCSNSDIGTKYFDIDIFEPTSTSCSGIEVGSKTVSSGNNSIPIYNRTDNKFYVTSVLFQNKQGLSAYASNSQLTIPANDDSSMVVGITGNGSLEMLVSGKFSDGKSCSFTQTDSGILSTGSSNNASSTSNTNTSIVNLSPTTPKITLVSYPTLITPITNDTKITLNINNSFSIAKEVTIKLAGFPNTFITESKTTTVSANDTKAISLEIKISDSAAKKAHKGYIEVYSNNLLIDKYPLTIDLSPATSKISVSATSGISTVQNRTYIITLKLKNNTNQLQETIIDFGLPEAYLIEGDREVNLLPNEETTKIYKIVSPTKLREDKVLNIKIRDKITDKELVSQEVSLKSGKSPISAFFTLRNTGFVLLGLVVLVVLIIIFRKK